MEVKPLSKEQYILQIKNRQDFENKNQKEYLFDFILPNNGEAFNFILNIVDIDDVEPSIIAEITPCIIEVSIILIYYHLIKMFYTNMQPI